MNIKQVKEIKKVLENCTSEIPCYKCKYYGQCEKLLTKENILTYINELESENERLEETVKDMSGIIKVHKYCVGADHCQNSSAREFELKDRIAELEEYIKGNEQDAKAFVNGWHKDLETELKQFAERIKMEFYYQFDELIPSIMADKIDEILKEFVNG